MASLAEPASELRDCLILRLQPAREADLVVSLFDREAGRVDAWARHGRKRSKRYGGRLDLLQQGTARLRRGRGALPDLTAFERTAELAPSGWTRLCLASTLAESALVAAQPEQRDPELFDWAVRGLRASATVPESALNFAALAIDLGFLRALGELPPLATCARCGEALDPGLSWPDAEEGPVCVRCLPCTPWPEAAIATLRAVLARPERCGELQIPRRIGRPVRQHADRLLANTLPTPGRSRAALREALSLAAG